MDFYLKILSISAVLLGSSLQNSMGNFPQWLRPKTLSSPHVIGGADAKPGEFPWQVAIWDVEEDSYNCSGSIIDDRHILTAGNCVDDSEPNRYRVIVGAHFIFNTQEPLRKTFHVSNVTRHPKWSALGDNDISLLTLARPITFNARVQRIPLAHLNSKIEGAHCTVSGWGVSERDTETFPQGLQKARVYITTQEDCKRRMGENLRESQICSDSKITGACFLDSGGPLVCSDARGYYLAGIVIHGKRSCMGTDAVTLYCSVTSSLGFLFDELYNKNN